MGGSAAGTIALPDGLTLSHRETGPSSEFAVVLLPGPTDAWRSYQPVLDRMPQSLRTVAVSQRGHGSSSKPAHGYGVEDFAADVTDLLDALEIRHAVLGGHSGSCITARRVALDRPDRVAGLVLEASPLTLRGNPGLTSFVQSVVAELEDPIDVEFARSVLVDTSTPDLAPALLDELVADLLQVPARVWHEMFAALLEYDDLTELGRISAPTLLIWGDADGLVGRDQQHELLRRLPKATLLPYAGIGHTPRWEDPARYAADVATFAERVRAGGPGVSSGARR